MTEAALNPAALAATHAAAFAQSRPWSETEIAALLANPLTFGIGDGRCFALVRVVVDEAELLTISTHPDHQRQGLARAVMQAWQLTAAQRGAATGFLEVAADNGPALTLYDSCGFVSCGTRPDYYRREDGSTADAVLMQRSFR